MKLSHAAFVARRVWGSLRELFWTHLLTSGTMAMTLFIFGAFVLVQENLQNLLKGWGDQIQIYAYLEKGIASDDVKPLMERVRSFPEIDRLRYVSREQAWEDFRKALGAQASVLEGLPTNVLPASFEITVKSTSRKRVVIENLANRLRQVKGIDAVEYPQEWVDNLSLVVLGVQWAKWIFGGVLFVAAFLIIGSTVRLAILARREEIEIMQLVGAPEGLIQAPFVVEGMIQGAAGGLLSVLCLWLLFFFLRDRIPASLGLFGPMSQIEFLDPWGIALLLFLGWSMGAAGSFFSLRRFTKTWGR